MAIQQVDLVGNSGRPVVTPQATEQLAGAFRSGLVSAQDIMERVSERQRAKQELELVTAQQGIADATNPQLIQAKQSQQLLAGEQAQQSRDLLPLARRATEEKLFGDINSGQIQRYGLKEKLAALNELGFAPSPDPKKGITPEFAAEVNKNFASLLRWQKDKADAKFELANIKQGEVDTGRGVFSGPTDILTAAPVEPGKVEALRTRAAKTLPEFLRDTPVGGVVAPVAAQPAAPLIQPAQPPVAQIAPVIQPAQPPVAQIAPVIQPAQAATVAQPITIQPTGVPPGFTQVKPAEITPESTANIKRTDALQRELLTLDDTKTKIATARSLAVSGTVGPIQYQPVQALHRLAAAFGIEKLPFQGSNLTQSEIYTNQQQLNNTISAQIASFVQDWKGAISNKELEFFKASLPGIGSTPELWKRYLDQWENTTENVRQVALGQLAPANAEEWAANPRSRLGATAPGTTPTGATPAAPPETPSAAPVFTLTEASKQPSGTIFKDANGNWRRKL